MLPALSQIVPADIVTYGLVFARVGAMVMTLPALGEAVIPSRVRLIIALGLTIVMTPVVGAAYANTQDLQPLVLTGMMIFETFIGIAIGMILRIFMGAAHVAGTVIATQIGLGFAQSFDPAQGAQSTVVTTFLSLLAVVLIFAGNLHHLLIAGIEHSFVIFPPGHMIPTGDFAKLAIDTVSESFALGIQMSAPFIAFGLILYGASGVIARLMPQVQVFFLVMPLNILAGFVLLSITVSAMMLWFLDAFSTKSALFVPH